MTAERDESEFLVGRLITRAEAVQTLLEMGDAEDARLLLHAFLADSGKALQLIPFDAESHAAQIRDNCSRIAILAGSDDLHEPLAADETVILCTRVVTALQRRLAQLRRGVWSTRKERVSAYAWRAGALLLVLAAVAAAIWGPDAYRQVRHGIEVRRTEETAKRMWEIARLAHQAKVLKQKSLVEIVTETCPGCGVCEDGKNLQNLWREDLCITRWRDAVTKIQQTATGTEKVRQELFTDGWGAPFYLNPNERETPTSCDQDELRSAGADGVLRTADDLVVLVDNALCK